MKSTFLVLTLSLVGLAEHAVAQQATSLLPAAASASISGVSDPVPMAPAKDVSPCNQYRLQTDAKLSFKQRFCFAAEPLVTPQFALQAAVMTAVGQLRHDLHPEHGSAINYPERFANYYARHSAQSAGEFMAGYLHHEDPRARRSNQTGFLRRTGAAFTSVLVARDSEGNSEVALAPIAGAFSSALVASVETGHRDMGMTGTLNHAGFVYSTYFIKAIVSEYKPELAEFTRRILHRQ